MVIQVKHEISDEFVDDEFNIEMLNVIVETSYPSTPIKIYLDNDLFGTNTDKDGKAVCGTSTFKDYDVRVEIMDEIFEDKICLD